MGNKIARTTQVSATEYYLHDLPSSYNLVLIEVLGRGRFFKSILCKHDEGLVLVKVYFKRGDPLDLREYERKLSEIRHIFHTVQHPHVWPFQFWLETDKAAYLLRQYFFSNLHDRLSTRPFLSLIEKKWIAYQLLCAVKQSHAKEVCHGDIKCENVLVTSWNWLYLADFASFKPTYIPDDDPSDFSFFFDTGGRRRCYLAPERFYDHVGEAHNAPDAPLKKSMDIFSVGCVIAELFLEGQPLFELSQLLAYRRGNYDPSLSLEKIHDVSIREMILHMIQLDPETRLSCDNYLQRYASAVFPKYFSPFLHKLFSCLIPLDSDTRVAMTKSAFSEIHKQMMSDRSADNIVSEMFVDTELMAGESLSDNGKENLNSLDDRDYPAESMVGKGLRLVDDIASLYMEVEKGGAYSHTKEASANILNVFTNSSITNLTLFSNSRKHFGRQSFIYAHGYKENEIPLFKKFQKSDLESLMTRYHTQSESNEIPFLQMEFKTSCEGMVLIAALLCSCMRSVRQPQLRRAGVLMLKSCSFYIDDEDRLQHVLPYVVVMLSDPAPIVRCAALETLCDVLALVRDFPPSDAKIFPEYILPMLSMLPDDPEQSVRICYASNIFKIALSSYRFLICSKNLADAGTYDKQGPSKPQLLSAEPSVKKQAENSDMQLAQLRKAIAEVVHELVMGSKQTPNIRRALLLDIGYLCYFFGQRQCNDFLLPILPAFLNDRDEQLRAVFYEQIVFVCYFVGQRSVEEYLLPYIEQALNDGMEAVIVNTLDCLSMLCRSGFLRKGILLDMIERSFPLLCYPSQWVRRSVATFITASSQALGPVDSYVYLNPILRPFLHRDPPSLYSESTLLSYLKPPLSKSVFYQVLEKTRSVDMLERQRKIWYNSSAQSNHWETLENSNSVAGDLDPMKNTWNKEPMAQSVKFFGNSVQKVTSSNGEDVAKLRKGIPLTASTEMDARDSFNYDKMHFSGFLPPHINLSNSFLFDGPSEGIPVYSYMDKHHMGIIASKSPDSSARWNSVGVASSCMPWVGSANKSTSLSNSVPPRLVSGSFFNTTSSKVAYDPDIHAFDPSSNITSKFQDVTVTDLVKSFSSSFGDEKLQSDITVFPSFSRPSAVPDAGWKPRGVLVAHLQEHCSSVNDIAVSNDNSFFVSASNDSSIKIWDTRKLEKDISFRSRLTYCMGQSQALCVTMLRGTSQIVAGASDGNLHFFAVDYVSRGLGNIVERYSGIADSRKRDAGEGPVLSVLNCSSSDSGICNTVLYSTRDCGIHLWDTRTNSDAWTFRVTPEQGFTPSLVMGQCGNWFVSGSSRGVLTLWDLRFLLPVNSWQYSTVCPVERMCVLIPSSNTVLATERPLIYVSAGYNEVSLWNAETGSCHQVFRVAGCESIAEISSIPRALARTSTKPNSKLDMKRISSSKYRIDELNESPLGIPGIRSLLPLPGGNLLTGGTDLRIRYWDHTSPEQSYSICGPSTKGLGNDELYETRSSFGVQVVQEMSRRETPAKQSQKALLAVAATDSAGCHRDSILSLASLKLNQRLLISSSRDGAIKVWK